MQGHSEISLVSLLLNADIVVKTVMAILFVASILSWALATEIFRRQFKVRRLMSAGERAGLAQQPVLNQELVEPARQAALVAIPGETGGEYLGRIERAMREGAARLTGKTDAGLNVIATIATVAPFVGLFGTVWGVTNSFTSIAGAGDTSLATVAPGIAEALFATALGLFAAIPAAVAHNRLGASRARLARMLDSTIRREAEVIASGRPSAATGSARLKVIAE